MVVAHALAGRRGHRAGWSRSRLERIRKHLYKPMLGRRGVLVNGESTSTREVGEYLLSVTHKTVSSHMAKLRSC